MREYILPAVLAALFGTQANAMAVSIGDLSYSGTGNIIEDSLYNREWLRWDVLADLNYQQTIDAIGVGEAYEGWNIATHIEAQQFTDALLSGLSNSCTITNNNYCDFSLFRSDVAELLGDHYDADPGN